MNKIVEIFRFLKKHWLKFVLWISLSLSFVFFLFPFDDLSDLVTTQVSKLTGGQIYLRFDRFSVSPLGPKAEFDNVFVETPSLPGLHASELSIAPSFMSMINKKPQGKVEAKGLLKGNVEIQIKGGAKTDKGQERHTIDLNVKKVSLRELRDLMRLVVPIKGDLSIQANSLTDFTFTEQPEGDINVSIDQFEMPASNINLPMTGPVNLPEIKLKQVELKGRITGGKFIIESGKIGDPKDELSGTIKGDMILQLLPNGGAVSPSFGSYSFSVSLKIKKGLQDKLAWMLGPLDAYKKDTGDGGQYNIKLSGAYFGGPPTFSALQ